MEVDAALAFIRAVLAIWIRTLVLSVRLLLMCGGVPRPEDQEALLNTT
jgi:hypothetical protein